MQLIEAGGWGLYFLQFYFSGFSWLLLLLFETESNRGVLADLEVTMQTGLASNS